MPSMEGGGVEKNIIIISNYLSKFINNLKLITYDKKKFKSHFNKNIKIISPKFKKKKISKYFKYFQCLLLLVKEVLYKKKYFSFFFSSKYLLFNFIKSFKF